MIVQKNKIDKVILCQNRWKKQTFFNKVQPVVSGITIFDLDFMKFDLDFSGIYVFDIPIDLDIDIAVYRSGNKHLRC